MKKKYKNILILVILLSFLTLNLISIDLVVTKIWEYTLLFIKKIFPVSFIFITISNLLIEYNFIQILQRIFRIKSPYIYIFILSLICGFPSGAIYTKKLFEKDMISIDDANKIIMFSHFPNPLFVINSVGTILHSKLLALVILFSIIISNFFIMILFINKNNKSYLLYKCSKDFSSTLANTITNTLETIVLIYGISLFFFLVSVVINNIINISYLYVIINGLFDLTYGVYSTCILNSVFIKGLLITIFISFGPISIHFQTKSILANTNVNYKYYLIGRFICCIISIIIYSLLNGKSNLLL